MNWENPSSQQLSDNEPQSGPSPQAPIESQLPSTQEPITPQSTPSPQTPITAATCKLPGFGYFLKETLSVYKNNFWKFLFISVIPFIASSIASFLLINLFLKNYYLSLSNITDITTKPSSGPFVLFIPIYLIVVIISLWSSLSILYAIKERENGISLGRALAKGWSSLGSGIWVSFLSFIIIAAGFVLLIIPGIIFSIWFLLALYVLVNEDKKGMGALKRSKELISGYLTAFWGRTLLFGLIFSIILLLFSFIIRFFSASLPILDHVETIVNIVAAPLFVIFSFLVYENIKKSKENGCTKSPREIKYILIALLLLLIPLGILASIVLVNVNSARTKANNIQIQAYMSQMRVAIEMYTEQTVDYSYGGVSCLASSNLVSICNDIKEAAGSEPTIRSSVQNYCLYVKLPKGGYSCLDNGYNYGGSGKTDIFPGGTGYCDGITFNCP